MSSRRPLQTRRVGSLAEVRQFFDAIAIRYRECHGAPDKLLDYRLRLIKSLLPPAGSLSLLEIGCGTGVHLFALSERFAHARGTDLSPGMIARAENERAHHPLKAHIAFAVDQAEKLALIGSDAIDVVLCVGALEHMLDKPVVLWQVRRVLKTGGVFVCLTPNGGYFWYTKLARLLGLSTRHLSTDQFLTGKELCSALEGAELLPDRLGYWTFIPRGDMPRTAAVLLTLLDWVGRFFTWPSLRGGLYCRAVKPFDRHSAPPL